MCAATGLGVQAQDLWREGAEEGAGLGLRLYSAHDSTLLALASALQLRHADGSALVEWPGYGAAMTLEVWQEEEEHRSVGGSTALVA